MQKYKLCELNKISAPEGAQSKRWYHYVISNGNNVINGRRSGTEKEVYNFARSCIKQLNQKYSRTNQHSYKPAYTHSPYELSF